MHMHLELEKSILFQSIVRDSSSSDSLEHSTAPIISIGPNARKVLCPQTATMYSVSIEHYRLLSSLSDLWIGHLTQRLNPRHFFTLHLFKEVLEANTLENQFFPMDGKWNLIPLILDNECVMISGANFGDGWRFSERRLRNESDTQAELALEGSRIILAAQ